MIHQTDSPTYPFMAFRKSDDNRIAELLKKTEEETSEEEKEEHAILCKNCGNKITSFEDIIEIMGQHAHIFSNPEGIVFQIGCYSTAGGCINRGVPTSEFTWFAGFNWRFSFCSKCHIHLGWFYQSKRTESFYGLILDRLVEVN